MKPTEQQLKDPQWWEENARPEDSHWCATYLAFVCEDHSKPCKHCIPRPTEPPEWDGEGLPPVGSVVEGTMLTWPGGWSVCRVIAHDGDSCVVAMPTINPMPPPENWKRLAWCDTFRVIKTERDQVIEQVQEKLGVRGDSLSMALLRNLYDIGALRVPEDD